jgi:hypothetical protein
MIHIITVLSYLSLDISGSGLFSLNAYLSLDSITLCDFGEISYGIRRFKLSSFQSSES